MKQVDNGFAITVKGTPFGDLCWNEKYVGNHLTSNCCILKDNLYKQV